MPKKPNANGLFELYTKEVMKVKFKFNSPNLADALMMLMDPPHSQYKSISMPIPIQPMGVGAEKNRSFYKYATRPNMPIPIQTMGR